MSFVNPVLDSIVIIVSGDVSSAAQYIENTVEEENGK